MAAGDCTISGAFTLDSTGRTAIEAHVESINTLSGGHVFVLPDANASEVWIGCVEGEA